ncbi:hypothetical protein ACWTCY_11520 [Anaerostipes caccae]
MEALERLKIELMAEGVIRMAIMMDEENLALIPEIILNEADILTRLEKIASDIMSELHTKDQHKISEKPEKLKEVIKHQKKILEIIG